LEPKIAVRPQEQIIATPDLHNLKPDASSKQSVYTITDFSAIGSPFIVAEAASLPSKISIQPLQTINFATQKARKV